MLVHSDNVYRALQQILQKTLQSNYQEGFGFHVYTHVHIATFLVFIPRYRTEDAQRSYAEHCFQFFGMRTDMLTSGWSA